MEETWLHRYFFRRRNSLAASGLAAAKAQRTDLVRHVFGLVHQVLLPHVRALLRFMVVKAGRNTLRMCWVCFAGCARSAPRPSPPHNPPRFDERNRAPLRGTATAGCHVCGSGNAAPRRFRACKQAQVFAHVRSNRSFHRLNVADVTFVADVRHSSMCKKAGD